LQKLIGATFLSFRDMSQHPKPRFAGKTVVITGATSGVGRAAALLFAHHGASVIAAARREEVLRGLVAEIQDIGGEARAVVTDVTDAAAMERLAQEAQSIGGVIDVWINNAGVLAVGAIDEVPAEVSERVIQTNLLGYLFGARAVLPIFKAQGRGVLINNISVGGWVPIPYGTAYSASKTGLLGLTGALQSELSAYPDIHVCGLYPAMLDTPGLQHAANYTGRVLTTMPPVFDPVRVAQQMLAVAIKPKRTATSDWAAPLMKLSYDLMPRLTGRISEWIFSSYFKRAAPETGSNGNLFDPSTPLTAINGGWRTPASRRRSGLLAGGLALAGVIAGLALVSRSKPNA
jgi:NAD(P)-dependent dehydrogenase (short-subunit alcohol dehydrogenase family)